MSDNSKKELDLTTGKPLKVIFSFAIPIMIGLVVQQLYSLADMIIVGKFLGVEALAAIGCTQGIIFLIFATINGLNFGVVTSMENNFGSKNYETVKRCVAICIIITFVFSAIMTIFTAFFCRDLIILIDTPEDLVGDAYIYLIIHVYGIEAFAFFQLLSNMIRGIGNSKIPTIIQTITVVLNIFLNIVAIVILKLAIMGAALATVISWLLGVMTCIFYIKRNFKVLHSDKKHFRFEKKIFIEHLVNGIAVSFQLFILSIGMVVRQIALNNIGSVAIASFVATSRIETTTTMSLAALGMAIKTYVAQNYGARKFDRIINGVKRAGILAIIISIVIALFNIFFGLRVVSIFISKYQTQVIEYARIFLITTCSFYWALASIHLFRSALQGMGQTLVPTLSGFVELLIRGLVVLFLVDIFGYNGICITESFTWLAAGSINFVAFMFTVKKWNQITSHLDPTRDHDNIVK